MPFRSTKQRAYIYEKASEGTPWAEKFIRDSGSTPPKVRRKRHRVRKI